MREAPAPFGALAPTVFAWIEDAPREEWGERWEIASRAMPVYNPRIATVESYLGACWAHRMVDRLRKKLCQRRWPGIIRGGDAVDLQAAPEPRELVHLPLRLRLEGEDFEVFAPLLNGCSYTEAARSLRIPTGTFKSRVWRIRERFLRGKFRP